MIRQTPQYIVCSNNRQRTGDRGQRTRHGGHGQRQTVTEGQRSRRRSDPGDGCGMAEEKPLDSAEAVTGAQGRGLIVVVYVGIFAGVIGIIAIITGVAMLDSEGRGRGGVQASPCQIEHAPVVGLIGYQIDGRNMQQGN